MTFITRHSFSQTAAALTTLAMLAGCATAAKDIATSYVSPVTYQSYECNQITAEITRVQQRSAQLAGRLNEAASNDKALAGVSLLLFWPAAFALGGTKPQEAEYAQLKGEYDALSQAAITRKCPGAVVQANAQAPEVK